MAAVTACWQDVQRCGFPPPRMDAVGGFCSSLAGWSRPVGCTLVPPGGGGWHHPAVTYHLYSSCSLSSHPTPPHPHTPPTHSTTPTPLPHTPSPPPPRFHVAQMRPAYLSYLTCKMYPEYSAQLPLWREIARCVRAGVAPTLQRRRRAARRRSMAQGGCCRPCMARSIVLPACPAPPCLQLPLPCQRGDALHRRAGPHARGECRCAATRQWLVWAEWVRRCAAAGQLQPAQAGGAASGVWLAPWQMRTLDAVASESAACIAAAA